MVRLFCWMFIIGMKFRETWIPNSGQQLVDFWTKPGDQNKTSRPLIRTYFLLLLDDDNELRRCVDVGESRSVKIDNTSEETPADALYLP